ncbi:MULTISPECIES: AAA family ATPase [Mesorhizobium]|uniref:ATP-binding protein n=4 Tax=Mesorhizobium TaxID=68287 RepID=A0ABZ0VJD0_9HYPH|nr:MULTISPECIES: ATP-binding protein [Mesorhizobium]MBZ9910310.1 AAA family ATPase [Mesorhizobium sp. BR115XR7A]QGX80527.1 AAA family ATPase [Mesorhizobium japonicum R7A]QJF04678.1 AAA family ATPase [Mesorhizobium japonicum R7A]QJF10747.1 AAA family ATPase [Mesorhizobium japonicum]QJI86620.1 AAA family ATPase [Mesorhizobium japonicum]
MEHFDIVLAIARIALSGDSERATHQVKRLREAVSKAKPDQAEKLARLLNRDDRRHSVAPMSLEQMRVSGSSPPVIPGEKLGRNTPLPNDRETATPLVRVVFPEDNVGAEPVLSPVLADALDGLIGEWAHTEELAALGVQPNMRCLLYGKPGVGKTMLARYIGAKLGLPIVEARLDGLVSSFLGTTARNIGALFDFADRYRCVLFLDEFDAIAKARDDAQEVGEIKRVVNALLQCLDARGRRGFTLAATNHEHLLDPAVWRRFDGRIEIPLPDADARKNLLARFLPPLTPGEAEMKMLVWMTEGMSGADIETLISGGKRFLVMKEASGASGSRRRGLLGGLRRQATLSGQLFSVEQRALLLGSNEELAAALVDNGGLTQREAGLLVGVSQSTVSRRRRDTANPLEA